MANHRDGNWRKREKKQERRKAARAEARAAKTLAKLLAGAAKSPGDGDGDSSPRGPDSSSRRKRPAAGAPSPATGSSRMPGGLPRGPLSPFNVDLQKQLRLAAKQAQELQAQLEAAQEQLAAEKRERGALAEQAQALKRAAVEQAVKRARLEQSGWCGMVHPNNTPPWNSFGSIEHCNHTESGKIGCLFNVVVRCTRTCRARAAGVRAVLWGAAVRGDHVVAQTLSPLDGDAVAPVQGTRTLCIWLQLH